MQTMSTYVNSFPASPRRKNRNHIVWSTVRTALELSEAGPASSSTDQPSFAFPVCLHVI